MRSKKAWVRIAEAFLAIILITGAVLILYSGTISKTGRGSEIYKLQETILDEISADNKLREDALSGNDADIRSFIETRVPPGFEFDIKICDIEKICQLDVYREEGKDVYSSERIISADIHLPDFAPKKLKIFMWEK